MKQLLDFVPPLKVKRFLGYRPNIWVVAPVVRITCGTIQAPLVLKLWSNANELCVVAKADGSTAVEYTLEAQENAIVLANAGGVNQDIHVVVRTNLPSRTNEQRKALLASICDSDLVQFLQSIKSSGMASLVQKIVRLRPLFLTHPDIPGRRYHATTVLKAIVLCMMSPTQSGHFVAHIGKYVQARQHLVKRLLVSMAEDTSWDKEAANFVSCGALLLSQHEFVHSAKFEDEVAAIAERMWGSSDCNNYEDAWRVGGSKSGSEPSGGVSMIARDAPTNRINLASFVHGIVGGMANDKFMMAYLRDNQDKYNAIKSMPRFKESVRHVPLDVYCDQHATGMIAMCFGKDIPLKSHPQSKTIEAPYMVRNHTIFRENSGSNPRRLNIDSNGNVEVEGKSIPYHGWRPELSADML
jgi:hypothetical protein